MRYLLFDRLYMSFTMHAVPEAENESSTTMTSAAIPFLTLTIAQLAYQELVYFWRSVTLNLL